MDHALVYNMATVISRGRLELLTVVPDTVLLELIAAIVHLVPWR